MVNHDKFNQFFRDEFFKFRDLSGPKQRARFGFGNGNGFGNNNIELDGICQADGLGQSLVGRVGLVRTASGARIGRTR